MRVLFCGQVPKDPKYPEAYEDAYEVSVDAPRLAISDGASESFDSRTWAQLLVNKFIRSTELNLDWSSEVVQQYNALFDYSELSWSKQASFERGSFATLLGVEVFCAHSSVEVLSIGDSLAVLLSDNDMIDSFPYRKPDEFQQRPELISTKSVHNGFISNPDFHSRHYKTWDLNEISNPALLCMTDALGEWALKMAVSGSPQWKALTSIKENDQLESIVSDEREKRRMRTDDVTLINIELSGLAYHEFSHT